ncbi:hypothetical protein BU25DRAFT_463930 [Macroventuria anomochaeta]|uniref:Uncharacterized protein n=1 Tax=Macroventuria anomochaeta TaxID=301207 RepID=A0ACB6RJ18_9PLEO|nr:uncharacterized protein BU25DRAFT_463930 [Macroventuria anomochaeta]KAF2621149.1 hypothetical protein BU25DRAFT_463930 [Macroventuria anomochaeta]
MLHPLNLVHILSLYLGISHALLHAQGLSVTNMGVVDIIAILWTLQMIAGYYYFNSASVIEGHIQHVKDIIIASNSQCDYSKKPLKPTYVNVEGNVRRLEPTWWTRLAYDNRWVGEVKAMDKKDCEHLLASTKRCHFNKADAAQELSGYFHQM